MERFNYVRIYSHWKAFVENSTILPVKPRTQAREVLCVVCVWYVVCGVWCVVCGVPNAIQTVDPLVTN